MKEWVGVLFAAACLVAAFALCAGSDAAEGRFYISPKGVRVWEAPGGGWEVATQFLTRDLGELEKFMQNKPPGLEAGKLFELMLAERGTWMGFSIRLGRVQRVIFTKSTKVVLVDKHGKRYESDGCFFYPDVVQSSLCDSRKSPVVVSNKTVLCHRKTGIPMMEVRFPDGVFRLDDIVEFEVVGAIEDTLQRAAE